MATLIQCQEHTRAKLGIYAQAGLLSLGKDGDFLKLGDGSTK
jgi:hypothetical protein